MDTRVLLAGSSLTATARDAAWCRGAAPTATPQAQASSKAMDVAYDRVGAALGAFVDALN